MFRHELTHKLLGWEDSNLRMPIPKTGALPLGYTPTKFNKCPLYETDTILFKQRFFPIQAFTLQDNERLLKKLYNSRVCNYELGAKQSVTLSIP